MPDQPYKTTLNICTAISRLQVKKGHVFLKLSVLDKKLLWKTRLKSVAGIQGYTQNSAQLRRSLKISVANSSLKIFRPSRSKNSAIFETNYCMTQCKNFKTVVKLFKNIRLIVQKMKITQIMTNSVKLFSRQIFAHFEQIQLTKIRF